ncbi:DUF1145 family protein [Proteus myxofaciens]|uniref:Putative inner membrane protein n=1 Tax=Proteus myxofaciens ATCC 19692 TaxID=1354337 RepID=A0A198F367_9GAMM|nr:DUF1145 family protein [Proteus myxofaciens]OAT19357.1 putative inner membrane protein [Proteus myxofaciens ATCC 19692]
MLIFLGRFLMIGVWAFLIFNFISPFPKPLKYFMDIALIFMVIMHGLQIAMYKAGQPADKKPSTALQFRIFFFGVFELLKIQKELRLEYEEKQKNKTK